METTKYVSRHTGEEIDNLLDKVKSFLDINTGTFDPTSDNPAGQKSIAGAMEKLDQSIQDTISNHSSSIATNTADIAKNTADIDMNTTQIEKNTTQIEKLNEGSKILQPYNLVVRMQGFRKNDLCQADR